MSDTSKRTGALEIEFTEEMLEAGEREIMRFDFGDWEKENVREAVRRVFRAVMQATPK